MHVLIIEDEDQAARRLESVINRVDPSIRIVGRTDSVKSSVRWLRSNPAPDLIFMDIQLGDGLSFEIFDRTDVKSPVVFTTAYDEFALRAFKVNSIDYILKPVDEADVRASITKLNDLISRGRSGSMMESIGQVVQMLTRKFKERFVVKVGEHLRTIEVKDISYFFSKDKATFAAAADGRVHILDFALEQIEGMVDPQVFFRVNRKYLIRADAINDIISFSNSRLKVILKGGADDDVIVARERVQEFRAWLDR